MEKGRISSISGFNCNGTIADGQGRVINFNSSCIVGRDRSSLKTGDNVWFERIGANTDTRAINIRLC